MTCRHLARTAVPIPEARRTALAWLQRSLIATRLLVSEAGARWSPRGVVRNLNDEGDDMAAKLPDLSGWIRTGTDISRDGIKYERWAAGRGSDERYIDVSVDKTLWREVPEPKTPDDRPVWNHLDREGSRST